MLTNNYQFNYIDINDGPTVKIQNNPNPFKPLFRQLLNFQSPGQVVVVREHGSEARVTHGSHRRVQPRPPLPLPVWGFQEEEMVQRHLCSRR